MELTIGAQFLEFSKKWVKRWDGASKQHSARTFGMRSNQSRNSFKRFQIKLIYTILLSAYKLIISFALTKANSFYYSCFSGAHFWWDYAVTTFYWAAPKCESTHFVDKYRIQRCSGRRCGVPNQWAVGGDAWLGSRSSGNSKSFQTGTKSYFPHF